jgi:hypothetical protein
MYYLETNSIRIFNKKLSTPFYLSNCYTSILSICELLAGIKDENTFRERKGIISMIYFSKIFSDNDLPETKKYKAYGISINSKVNEGIVLLGALCVASESYQEFQEQIPKHLLTEYWNFLEVYDNVDTKFKESYKMRQEAFDYSDPTMVSDFNKRWDNLDQNPELKSSILNDLIIYFAKNILEDNIVNINGKSLYNLVQSYDHSLDIFFLCIAYFTGTKMIFRNAPSRNDYLDMAHLMYLSNSKSVIVSNDRMIRKVLMKINPNNFLSADEFGCMS